MQKIWDIHGGVHPNENKAQSLQTKLQEAPLPELVVLPLNMHAGAPAIPCVVVGDRVKRGQMVAEPSGAFSAAIHASISGAVVAIEDRPVSHPSGNPGRAIVIQSDGLDESTNMPPIEDYRQVPVADLVTRVRDAGIAGLGGAGFPTHIKLKPISTVDTLIINGAECEPYITADNCLMREFADKVIEGIELLAYMLGEPKQILFGVEDNKKDAIEALQKAVEASSITRPITKQIASSIEIVTIPTKYPSGGEKQLIQILTGKEVPSGKLPANLGIVMHNPGTAVAILDAVTKGLPLTSRITTFVGDNLQQSGNYRIRIGTTLAEILPSIGLDMSKLHKIVLGGPMMGFAMPDLNTPLLKISNCVLVPSAEELPDPDPAQPCIRCGSCAEVCPAQLLPQQLFWFAQAEDHQNLQNHNLFDCIECGACSYVCPSNIPLVQYYRASKGSIREADRERIASDRARRRFELRNERMEKETQEREAKRAARMQAAKAKKANAEPSAGSSDEDLVAAAMARVKAQTAIQNADGENSNNLQKQSLEERISGLQAKVEAAESDLDKKKFEAELANTRAQLDRLQQQPESLNSEQVASAAVDSATVDSAPVDAAVDTAAAAIERAKLKAQQQQELPESEKLAQSLAAIQKRIQKAEERVAQAKAENSDTLEALEKGLEKMRGKETDLKTQLAELSPKPEPLDAASAAIERAKQKALQQAELSDAEKLQQSLESLNKRIAKASERTEQARADGSDTLEVLETSLAKLQAKQADLQAQLDQASE